MRNMGKLHPSVLSNRTPFRPHRDRRGESWENLVVQADFDAWTAVAGHSNGLIPKGEKSRTTATGSDKRARKTLRPWGVIRG
jgi:hypothetical protein